MTSIMDKDQISSLQKATIDRMKDKELIATDSEVDELKAHDAAIANAVESQARYERGKAKLEAKAVNVDDFIASLPAAEQEKIEKRAEELIGDNDFDSKPTGMISSTAEHKAREIEQNASLAKNKEAHPLFKPFENHTGVANLGSGSFASLLYGTKVNDLKGNVVEGKSEGILPQDIEQPFVEFPLLRYINLPGISIELKYYAKADRYRASYTTDGKTFEPLAKGRQLDAAAMLSELSKDRALAIQPIKARIISESKRLEEDSSMSDIDEQSQST